MGASSSGGPEAAATLLLQNRLTGGRFAGFPEPLRPASEADAYLVQARLHDLFAHAQAGAIVGHKIGCTTPVMQAYLGIANPCAGGVLGRNVHQGHAALAGPAGTRLGVECELAVRLGADLSGRIDRARVTDAVASVMPAIEIVEDRYVDYRALDTPSLIADDFFSAGCVLGPACQDWRALDLTALAGAMRINGQQVGQGRGADILGDPLEALLWLARLRAAQGDPLRAGTFVLLGSLVQTVWLAPGDRVAIDVAGLGGASLTLA